MDKIKITQWNCRGLSKKVSELLVFLKEKDTDMVCLADNDFEVTDTKASKSHGSMISVKKRTTKIEVKPKKFDRIEREKVLEILKSCFEIPVLCQLLVFSSSQLTRLRSESVRIF